MWLFVVMCVHVCMHVCSCVFACVCMYFCVCLYSCIQYIRRAQCTLKVLHTLPCISPTPSPPTPSLPTTNTTHRRSRIKRPGQLLSQCWNTKPFCGGVWAAHWSGGVCGIGILACHMVCARPCHSTGVEMGVGVFNIHSGNHCGVIYSCVCVLWEHIEGSDTDQHTHGVWVGWW